VASDDGLSKQASPFDGIGSDVMSELKDGASAVKDIVLGDDEDDDAKTMMGKVSALTSRVDKLKGALSRWREGKDVAGSSSIMAIAKQEGARAASAASSVLSDFVPFVNAAAAAYNLVASTAEAVATAGQLLRKSTLVAQQLTLAAEAAVDENLRVMHDTCSTLGALRIIAGKAVDGLSETMDKSLKVWLGPLVVDALGKSADDTLLSTIGGSLLSGLKSAMVKTSAKLEALFDTDGRCSAHLASLGLTRARFAARAKALGAVQQRVQTPPGSVKPATDLATDLKSLFPFDSGRVWTAAEQEQLALAAPIAGSGKVVGCPYGGDVIMDVKLSTTHQIDGQCTPGTWRVDGLIPQSCLLLPPSTSLLPPLPARPRSSVQWTRWVKWGTSWCARFSGRRGKSTRSSTTCLVWGQRRRLPRSAPTASSRGACTC